ncbi:MAG TPA: PAS domain-containing protein, partial [Caulobacteraceae bacterium]
MARKSAPVDVEAEAARWFFQNSDDLFIVMRRRVVTWVNPAWTTLTGWKAADIIGRPLTDFAHADDAALIKKAVRALQTKGKSSAEHRMRARSGEWLWFRSRSTRPEDGTVLIVSQHITEDRKRQ